jgi:hypothetical protein
MNAVPNPGLYEQLLALPGNLVGEVIAGRLYVHPRPRGRHAVAAGGLNIDLGGAFGFGRGGPGAAKDGRVVKLPLYARFGVAHVWLVDPLERTLEAFALRDGAWVLAAVLKDDDPVSVAPFDAITFSLADLWV